MGEGEGGRGKGCGSGVSLLCVCVVPLSAASSMVLDNAIHGLLSESTDGLSSATMKTKRSQSAIAPSMVSLEPSLGRYTVLYNLPLVPPCFPPCSPPVLLFPAVLEHVLHPVTQFHCDQQ